MEATKLFCHTRREYASGLQERESVYDLFEKQLKEVEAQCSGQLSDDDFQLIKTYLLLPFLNVESINELPSPKADKARLYWILSQNRDLLSSLLTKLSYPLLFAQLAAFGKSSASSRSLYRPHLIGDDTKVAKAHSKCMAYLTELFCPVEEKKLPAYNLVVLCLTFGDTGVELPIDIRLWVPKTVAGYQSKPKLMKEMVLALQRATEAENLSLSGVVFSCDAAYQRSNALMQTVNYAKLKLVTKVSSNMTFIISGQRLKAGAIIDKIRTAEMKQSSRLGPLYRYKRLIAHHPVLGKVLLIVSQLYSEKQKKYRRILLMSNDLSLQAPKAISLYKARWRIEVYFKTVKQHIALTTFQLRRLSSVFSHFQLRIIASFMLAHIRKSAFVHYRSVSIRKLTKLIMYSMAQQGA